MKSVFIYHLKFAKGLMEIMLNLWFLFHCFPNDYYWRFPDWCSAQNEFLWVVYWYWSNENSI